AYLTKKMKLEPFPYFDAEKNKAAKVELEFLDIEIWLHNHLTEEQKKRMNSALRSRKSREKNQSQKRVVSLTLSSAEYMRLLNQTDAINTTVGEVIKKRLFDDT
ncbi:MAG: hypothetical protein Q9M28_02695, partial [Mariprofundaceae bacterium]|nr:hypothetical protein [Mariprofundaceae bacterium]